MELNEELRNQINDEITKIGGYAQQASEFAMGKREEHQAIPGARQIGIGVADAVFDRAPGIDLFDALAGGQIRSYIASMVEQALITGWFAGKDDHELFTCDAVCGPGCRHCAERAAKEARLREANRINDIPDASSV